jgi:hypothetical protein
VKPRRALWTASQVVVVALILWFLGRYVEHNWGQIRGSSDALRLDAKPLATALLIILATYAMLIAAWRAVLRGWRERIEYPAAARIWCLSNLARYLPGRIWQIAGMAALAQKAGVSAWAAAGSSIVVQLLSIATGALVTALFAPQFGHPLLIGLGGAITAAGAAALALPGPTALVARGLSRLAGRQVELRAVRPGPLLLSAAITAAAWAAYGLALVYCADGLVGGRGLDAAAAIGVFTGSYIAGYINIFTAGGLGTRELILVYWLTGPLGPKAALVVTFGSRLLMTVTELVAALITLPLRTSSADVTS